MNNQPLCLAKRIILLLFLIMTFSISRSQPTEKPYMWLAKDVGSKQIHLFKKNKLQIINQKIGAPQTDSFFLGNFFGMIKYFEKTYDKSFNFLHVFIGVCYKTGRQPIPDGYDKKLIFIFCPTAGNVVNNKSDFYILPASFDESKPTDAKITFDQQQEWTKNYIKVMPIKTIDPKDPDNQYENWLTHKKYPSDTRSVSYCRNDLDELIAVKSYYESAYNISDNAAGYLASYSSTGMPKGKDKGRFKKRIICQFLFLDKDNHIFYLESIAGFLHLKDGVSKCNYSNDKKKLKDVDNGQLCPTYCPQ